MKKHSMILMKFTVGLTIFLGLLLILATNQKSFRKIVADDVENISKLSASIIYSEIDNSLTKPIFVGQTMANDLFLKNWLSSESDMGGNPTQIAMIQKYLSDYKEKYGYSSVFLISAKSNIYYYNDGINKVINTANDHDIWYYDFIKGNSLYKLNVDMDEVNSNELTVFVDCKVKDDDGNLIGVVGVGVKMSHLQKLLQKYENEYDLKALLIDDSGLIQVDSIVENIEASNFFNDPVTLGLKDKILEDKTSMEIFWYSKKNSDHCLITKYIDNLDWYIVIEKNTANVEQVLINQINSDLLVVAIVIMLVILMISSLIAMYNRMLLRTATTDDVTNLPNVKMFQEIFNHNCKRAACLQGTLFLFDVDHFKNINDKFGHLFGNTVLYHISEISKTVIGNKGVVARWGGDEFVGVIYGPYKEADETLLRLASEISQSQENEIDNITISIGVTRISGIHNFDSLIQEADTAMYKSKESGRNKITFFK